jgi:hypothetical protein
MLNSYIRNNYLLYQNVDVENQDYISYSEAILLSKKGIKKELTGKKRSKLKNNKLNTSIIVLIRGESNLLSILRDYPVYNSLILFGTNFINTKLLMGYISLNNDIIKVLGLLSILNKIRVLFIKGLFNVNKKNK